MLGESRCQILLGSGREVLGAALSLNGNLQGGEGNPCPPRKLIPTFLSARKSKSKCVKKPKGGLPLRASTEIPSGTHYLLV